MTYGYARVSTTDQTTARQVDAFNQIGVDCIIEEHGSGKDFENRPKWRTLRRRLKSGDVLVVASLDRMGRNYDEIIEEWRYITKERGADIRVLDMPLLCTDAGKDGLVGRFVSDLVLQVLSFVAQFEREKIKQRQAQGIAAAKARGVRFGRPEWIPTEGFRDVAMEEIYGNMTCREAARRLGISMSTYWKYSRTLFADEVSKARDA